MLCAAQGRGLKSLAKGWITAKWQPRVDAVLRQLAEAGDSAAIKAALAAFMALMYLIGQAKGGE
jgi:hypothetical protein